MYGATKMMPLLRPSQGEGRGTSDKPLDSAQKFLPKRGFPRTLSFRGAATKVVAPTLVSVKRVLHKPGICRILSFRRAETQTVTPQFHSAKELLPKTGISRTFVVSESRKMS